MEVPCPLDKVSRTLLGKSSEGPPQDLSSTLLSYRACRDGTLGNVNCQGSAITLAAEAFPSGWAQRCQGILIQVAWTVLPTRACTPQACNPVLTFPSDIESGEWAGAGPGWDLSFSVLSGHLLEQNPQ